MALSQQQMDSVRSRIVYNILPDRLQGAISLPGVRRDCVEDGIPIEEYRLLLFPEFPETHGQVIVEHYGVRYNLTVYKFAGSFELSPLAAMSPVQEALENWLANTALVDVAIKEDQPINRFHEFREKLNLSFKSKEVVLRIQRTKIFTSIKDLLDE